MVSLSGVRAWHMGEVQLVLTCSPHLQIPLNSTHCSFKKNNNNIKPAFTKTAMLSTQFLKLQVFLLCLKSLKCPLVCNISTVALEVVYFITVLVIFLQMVLLELQKLLLNVMPNIWQKERNSISPCLSLVNVKQNGIP